MYASHVPIIAAGMRSDAGIFRRGVLFAILSARQRFTDVPIQLEAVETFEQEGSIRPLLAIARALQVDLDDLVPWTTDDGETDLRVGAVVTEPG